MHYAIFCFSEIFLTWKSAPCASHWIMPLSLNLRSILLRTEWIISESTRLALTLFRLECSFESGPKLWATCWFPLSLLFTSLWFILPRKFTLFFWLAFLRREWIVLSWCILSFPKWSVSFNIPPGFSFVLAFVSFHFLLLLIPLSEWISIWVLATPYILFLRWVLLFFLFLACILSPRKEGFSFLLRKAFFFV